MSRRRGIQAALLLTALALVILGVLQGDSRDVLMKATRICMECIGLG